MLNELLFVCILSLEAANFVGLCFKVCLRSDVCVSCVVAVRSDNVIEI